MHNYPSNQLGDWKHSSGNSEDEEKINDYYACLIECNDTHSSCKRICSDILM